MYFALRLSARYLLVTVLSVSVWAPSLWAAPYLELMDTPTPDRPFGGRSSVSDGSAAYFNPARLSVTQRSFSISYLAHYSKLQINGVARPTGYDIPESIYQAKRLVNGEALPLNFRPLPTADISKAAHHGEGDDLKQNIMMTLSMPLIDGMLSLGMTSIFLWAPYKNYGHFSSMNRRSFSTMNSSMSCMATALR